MSTKVIMPQMGESIAEGTITKWLKKVGDTVERDEPLFEISTDKVDAEIPSPAAGTLIEILAEEGETVEVNKEVALIGEKGAKAGKGGKPAKNKKGEKQAKATQEEDEEDEEADEKLARPSRGEAADQDTDAGDEDKEVEAEEKEAKQEKKAAREAAPAGRPEGDAGRRGAARTGESHEDADKEELRRTRSSPVVRKIAEEHGVDITAIQGTGISGRVTKRDILAYVEGDGRRKEAVAPAAAAGPAPRDFQGAGELREPMSVMRKKIAERMVEAKRIAAHVHTVFDVDLTDVGKLRARHKERWKAQEGVNLTWLPFIQRAAIDALKKFPLLNAAIDGDDVVYHRDVNLGVAVALDWGLIVPVIKRADELSLLGLTRATVDLAERARGKRLKPDEVAGNTFTITNPGAFGGRFGTPIIPPPTVAILGVGVVEKRPVVRDDAIAIRTMCTLSLGFDHRLIDGAVADQFMAEIKRRLQAARFEGLD